MINWERGEERDVPNAKLALQRIKPGEGFNTRSGGGGGFGPPIERKPEKVAYDVREGYVSIEEAREIYRVALLPDGGLDLEATAQLRQDTTNMA